MKLHAILLFLVFVVRKSFPNNTNVIDVDKIEFCSALNCREEYLPNICVSNSMKLHAILLFLVFVVRKSFPNITNGIDVDKIEFCSALNCREDIDSRVCGIRPEGEGFRLKLFQNECKLLKYGCSVDEANAYGLINTEYCDRLFGTDESDNSSKQSHGLEFLMSEDRKSGIDVSHTENASRRYQNLNLNATNKCNFECGDHENKEVCGIREDGVGYRIRLFDNYCELTKHNCETDKEFILTDIFICKDTDRSKDNVTKKVNNPLNTLKVIENNVVDDLDILNGSGFTKKINEFNKTDVKNNLIVVNSKMFGQYDNLNDSIDTFFAASHVFDLPLKEVPFNTRRKMLKYAGPIKVFVPWIEKPSNISNDTFHRPTLSSCYHKCPYKCPDTYAPVCGVPGIVAREPSLMFQNHCFMDVAQCKMFWENRSSTAQSSSYVESSFLFCMGDEMNAVYRFLPAIRTLQRMGRLKKKGKFRAILKNFRFVSEFRYGRPKFMGRK